MLIFVPLFNISLLFIFIAGVSPNIHSFIEKFIKYHLHFIHAKTED